MGSPIVVLRPEANSPLAISRRQPTAEIIRTYVARGLGEEVTWVSKQVRELLSEGLNPSDVMVVCLDDQNARTYFKDLSGELASSGIQINNLLADPYSEPSFTIPDHITLSTVYRAKGNEAAVVFAIGMDALFPSRREQKARNKLFTAFTRAKGWLRTSGVGPGAQYFVNEINRAVAEMPRLVFTQPDPTQILTLQRDLSDRSSKLRKIQEQLDRQLGELDFDPEEREAFISSLQKKR